MSLKDQFPVPTSAGPVQAYQPGPAPDWGDARGNETEPAPANPIRRYIQAILRFKWMVLLFLILGVGAGYLATKFIQPEYEVDATIAMSMSDGGGSQQNNSPLQQDQLLNAQGWLDLLHSASVVDPVVEQLGLYLQPTVAADSALFRDFRTDQRRLQPGRYTLTINGDHYTLKRNPEVVVEAGAVGDSIGRRVGFAWQPTVDLLGGRKQVAFSVQTLRETSKLLLSRIKTRPPPIGSPFIYSTLSGRDPVQTATILNAWMDQFVTVAAALKKGNVKRQAEIWKSQLDFQRGVLARSEIELQNFRVKTVTQPSEHQAYTMAAGLTMTSNPVYQEYFNTQMQAARLHRDAESFDSAVVGAKQRGGILPEALLSIPTLSNDPASTRLRELVNEQVKLETDIRLSSEKFTPEAPVLKAQLARLALLKDSVIPTAATQYRVQVRHREDDLANSLKENEGRLHDIPERTIKEEGLIRTRDQDAALYTTLDKMTNEARLREAATIPDVKVQDPAVAPLLPTKNTKPIIFSGVVAIMFALGLGLAILLDQVDKRFRYPAQATDDLGLFILGVVPVVSSKKGKKSADQAAQVVEAFRTIRMNVRYAAEPGRPLTITITSPGPNDGKSLISSNLALSFAEAGSRTLLIDGDIRRGELAQTFGTQSRPGLVEYLDGTALIAEVLHPTNAHTNLTVMPAGARRRRAPELLATTRLPQLINQLATEYDVVVVDSPPLGAGADAYALGTATGNMAVVLRTGLTDRKMAQAKLAILDTLPIRLMGAILNGIKLTGEYQYYAYYQDYAAEDEEPKAPRLSSGTSSRPTPPPVARVG